MNNENKKNYYNLLKGQLQICEDKQDEKLRKQWQENIDFEKRILFEEFLQNLYYDLFVDEFLVKLIEEKIKNVNSKDDSTNKFKVKITFYHSITSDTYHPKETKYEGKICLREPESFRFSLNQKDNIYLRNRKKLLGLYHLVYNNLSTYFDVSNDFDEVLTYTHCDITGFCLSFEGTLKELINMYYMEKQRQEYENYDARKLKIK